MKFEIEIPEDEMVAAIDAAMLIAATQEQRERGLEHV